MKPISVAQLVNREALAGRPAGLADLPKFLASLPRDGKPLVLDFAGVGSVSGSYFNAGLAPLIAVMRDAPNAGPLVVVGARDDVLEDLEGSLHRHEATIVAATWKDGRLHDPKPLGPLDETSRQTLEILEAEGAVSAAELADRRPERISRTAWSNRLIALYTAGLAKRHKQGRTMYYVPTLTGLSNGN